jgi:hypothetical protein
MKRLKPSTNLKTREIDADSFYQHRVWHDFAMYRCGFGRSQYDNNQSSLGVEKGLQISVVRESKSELATAISSLIRRLGNSAWRAALILYRVSIRKLVAGQSGDSR